MHLCIVPLIYGEKNCTVKLSPRRFEVNANFGSDLTELN